MSKSLGNFVTVQEALKKYEPNVLKIFFLSAHYGSPMDFTFDGLENTKRAYGKIGEFLDKVSQLRPEPAGDIPGKKEVDSKIREFEKVMDDDFNTPQGLAVFFELLTLGNKYLASKNDSAALYACSVLMRLGKVLGLNLKPPRKTMDISAVRIKIVDSSAVILEGKEIEKLVAERDEARRRKDFKSADEIRDYLKRHGIIVEDKEKTI